MLHKLEKDIFRALALIQRLFWKTFSPSEIKLYCNLAKNVYLIRSHLIIFRDSPPHVWYPLTRHEEDIYVVFVMVIVLGLVATVLLSSWCVSHLNISNFNQMSHTCISRSTLKVIFHGIAASENVSALLIFCQKTNFTSLM